MPREQIEEQSFTSWKNPEVTKSPNGKVVRVDKITAGIERSYSFCLDRHIPRFPEDLPENLNAVLLEGGGKHEPWTNWIKVDESTGQQLTSKDFLDSYRFGRKEYAGENGDGIYRVFEREKIPIIIGDPVLNDMGLFYHKFIAAAETSIAVSTLISLYRGQQVPFSMSMDRRSFIKLPTLAWSLMPALSAYMYYKHGNQAEFIPPEWRDEFIKWPHPELWLFTLTARDVIVPHKKEWLAQYTMGRESTHIATTIGAAHSGMIDEMRRSPSQREAFLNTFGFLIREAFYDQSLYKTTVFKYNKDKKELQDGQVFEIPSLKRIALPNLYSDNR